MSHNSVIPMPRATHLHDALHAMKRVHGTDVALILPDNAPNLDAVTGLEQVLTWAQAAGKDITLIGGSAYARAEAIARGLRAATDVPAWQAWLEEAHARDARHERRLQTGGQGGWRVVQRTRPLDDNAPPAYVTNLGEESGIIAFAASSDIIPADERFEESVIAQVWQTGALGPSMPTASNA